MSSIIEARGLTRRFGELVAVNNVQFDVEDGEIFGFLGPNGAGKTTTVRMLTGVIDPTEGTARIEDHDIRNEPLGAREHLGIVPEEANVYLDLSVWRNVMIMAELHAMPKAQREKKANDLLERLGLGDRHRQKARALSKGLRQRLMLCSALVSDPEVLFLDEPTGGLDVQSTRLIHEIVREMNDDGLTVFLTTHDMVEAEQLCDRVAIINEGEIVATDTPKHLQQAMTSNQYVEVSFAGGDPPPNALEQLGGVNRVDNTNGGWHLYTDKPGQVTVQVVKYTQTCGLGIASIATCQPTLEDVFVDLTSDQKEEGGQQ